MDVKANIKLCKKYVYEMCKTKQVPCLTIPPNKTDFDIQLINALEELEVLREENKEQQEHIKDLNKAVVRKKSQLRLQNEQIKKLKEEIKK